MARGDDFDYFVPDDWYGAEKDMFDNLVNGDPVLGQDKSLQLLFDVALFDHDIRPGERDMAYDALVEYMWDEYEIDFDDVFDWDDYREWYEGAVA